MTRRDWIGSIEWHLRSRGRRPFLRYGRGALSALFLVFLLAPAVSGQTTIVDFENPAPPGLPGGLLDGVFQGIDFGIGRWRWERAFGADATNNIYFDSGVGTARTFTFAPAPRILNSIRVFSLSAGTLTLTDDVGQTRTQSITVGMMELVTTGWTQPSTTVTVAFTSGWDLGVDDIDYTLAAPAVPTVSTLSPSPVVVGAASTETTKPLTVSSGVSGFSGYALRFHANGVNDIDRVKIRIDDPTTSNPDPPANVGASDFTLEFWAKGTTSENPAAPVQCGANNNWIYGNIIVDRDRYNAGRKYGVSAGGGQIAFGVTADAGSATICGTTNFLDGQWHHIAVQRAVADGQMWLYVDGQLDARGAGPGGDISYPFHAVPGRFCGWTGSVPCVNDPFLVLGAEKHDAGSSFPSFSGWIDEVRLSNSLRYLANFTRPFAPFTPDGNTVALYHFDEGQGNVIRDSSGAAGGPSPGTRNLGGSPAGPEWVTDTPFGSPPSPPTISITALASGAAVSGLTTIAVTVSDGAVGVQFLLDDANLGEEVTTSPFAFAWDTRAASNGCHTLSARVRDASGTLVFATPVVVAVANGMSAPSGLVGAYGFNEGNGRSAADASCNGNTGAINGASWTSAGRFGGALVFDGSNSWVTVLDSPSLHLSTAMTLEAWVYPIVTATNWQALVNKEQRADLAYWLDASSPSGNTPVTGVFIGGEQNLFAGSQLPVNAWTHLAATYDGATLRLFVNGVLVANRSQGGAIVSSSGSLRIGGDNIWGDFFEGRIDEVRIYNRALSQAEIEADMTTPIMP